MDLLVNFEIVAFIVLPFVLGILRKRGAITEKQVSFTFASVLSLIIGSYYLSLRNPETLFSLTLGDWSVAVALSLFCWVIAYAVSRSILRQ
jgi:hypothetical protein